MVFSGGGGGVGGGGRGMKKFPMSKSFRRPCKGTGCY